MKQEKQKSGALKVISARKITPELFMKRLGGHKVEEPQKPSEEIQIKFGSDVEIKANRYKEFMDWLDTLISKELCNEQAERLVRISKELARKELKEKISDYMLDTHNQDVLCSVVENIIDEVLKE